MEWASSDLILIKGWRYWDRRGFLFQNNVQQNEDSARKLHTPQKNERIYKEKPRS